MRPTSEFGIQRPGYIIFDENHHMCTIYFPDVYINMQHGVVIGGCVR